jgi:orotidine-5'-phosphate decarboxylase
VVTDALLVALDVDTVDHATALADQLRGVVGGFKIGSRLFTSQGPSFVEHLVSRGDRVFLDLKFHDIPNTVAGAVVAATRLGVWIVIAVTILTSLSERMLAEIGIDAPMTAQVERLAALAQSAGLDGVVASPQEISLIRARCGAQFTIVTPGIRPDSPGVEVRGAGAPGVEDDQQRTLTAAQALSAGASYLVVGRPIIAAPDPRLAAERIAADCRAASAP